MSGLPSLIGDKVLSKSGDDVSTTSFAGDGKVVGLYFSAHWCPPCRGFTPQLAEFYKKMKAGSNGANFELVFVSSDRDEESFKEYFNEMPWLAVPFADRDRKNKLSKIFKVQGIPTLAFVDGHGKLITKNGRGIVGSDPEGKEFPWLPKPLTEILQGKLKKKKEDVDSKEALTGKILGFYFSAHWCPPCRDFTPKLVSTYKKIKESGKNFEIVFISSDRSQDSFEGYFDTMPWLAVPYGDARINLMKERFNVSGIPSLIIVDEKGEVIKENGRGAVSKDPEGKEFPWLPKPVEELDDSTAVAINDAASLILFGKADDQSWASKALGMLEEPAKQYKEECKTNSDMDAELNFFYEVEDGDDVAESIRAFAQLGDQTPLLVLLDIPERRVFISEETNITKETVEKVLADYKAGSIAFKPLRS